VIVPAASVPPFTVVGATDIAERTGGLTVRVAVLATPRVAVIVAVVLPATAEVVTVKVAVVAPPATLTLAGTVAAAALLSRPTAIPPLGAGPSRVTVPVDWLPPVTAVGLSPSPETTGAFTVRVVVFETPLRVAVIVAWVSLATAEVVTGKVVDLALAGTVTDAGTLAPVVLLRVTTNPPAGAGPSRMTVPVAPVPPVTAVGLTATALTLGMVTINVAVCVAPPLAAVIVTVVLVVTVDVLIVKVAVLCPASTVTDAGTGATLGALLVKVTVVLLTAGPSRVTVPVDGLPPASEVGLVETAESTGKLTVRSC
jgi:hypothetical protein